MVYLEGLAEEFYDPDQDENEEDLTDDWATLAASTGAQYRRKSVE